MSKHAARRPSSHATRRLRRPALVSGAVAVALLLLSAAIPGVPRTAAPVEEALRLAAAGVPEAGTPIFTETFSAQNASATGINILNYVGTDGMTYDADLAYTPAGGQCNGWVMNSLTPQPTAAQDAGCANNQPDGWNQLRQMAVSLGLAQGQSAAEAANNQVLTEYTNATNGAIPAGYELKSEGSIPAVAGHYYAVSAYFAEVNCFAAHARMTFSLVIDGTPTVLSSGLDPCTAPGGSVPIPNGARVVKLQSAALQLPGTGTPSLGLQLYNAATSGSGNDVSFDLPQIVDVTPSLDKSFNPALIAPGGVSTLTFTVTNTSELMAKSDWSFTDNLPSGLRVASTPNVGGSCTSTTGAPLVRTAAAGSTSIAVTGGDLAVGQASCTVTVDVTSNVEGPYVNGPANVTTNLLPPENTPLEVRAPRIRLVKALDAPRITDVDQFTMQIRSGTAAGPVVNNTAASTTQGAGSTVTPGTGTTGTYVADVNTTYVLTETATSGTDLGAYDKSITCVDANSRQTGLPSGANFTGALSIQPVAGANITCTLTNSAAPEPGIELLKRVASVDDVNGNGLNDLGDEINFVFDVSNTGNVTLTGVAVDDPLLAGLGITVTCDPTTLVPGDTVTCEADAPYVITQADVDAGTVENVATATGTPPSGPEVETPESPTVTPLDGEAAIELVKTADKTDLVVGETMTYSFVATNTGDVTLSDVVVEESAFTGSGTVSAIDCDPVAPSVLAPGESMECTATYVVTQADVDAGQVDNTALATGTPPSGPNVTDEDDVQVPGTSAPGIELLKRVASVDDVNGNGLNDLGDEINFVFDVSNTGNVTLTGVAVDDPLLAGLGITVTCAPTTLAPGASVTCTADAPYVITQADVDAGTVENIATATGNPPSGYEVETPESPTVTPLDGAPGIELVKTADRTDLVVGETMTYTFVATNTGDVTLSDVVIEESAFTGSGTVSPLTCDPAAPSVLAPGESMECTATYVVTQADVDAGQVDNTATTTGTPPSGPNVTDEDDVIVPGTSEPGIELNKRVGSVEDVNGNDLTDLGDEINFVFDVENTGNVTLSDISVDDPLLDGLGITVTCDPATIAPGDTVTCEADAPYVITQADVDAGTVENVATATGNPPTGPPVTSNPDETVTELDDEPALVLDKRAATVTDVDGDGLTDAGDEIEYVFDLTNTGNVTLTELTVDDPMLVVAGIAISCPVTSLAPLENVTCVAEEPYVITAADVVAGSVRNTATATYTPPGQPPVVTPPDSVETPVKVPDSEVSSGSSTPDSDVLPNTGGPSLLLVGGAGAFILAGLLLVGRGTRTGRRRGSRTRMPARRSGVVQGRRRRA